MDSTQWLSNEVEAGRRVVEAVVSYTGGNIFSVKLSLPSTAGERAEPQPTNANGVIVSFIRPIEPVKDALEGSIITSNDIWRLFQATQLAVGQTVNPSEVAAAKHKFSTTLYNASQWRGIKSPEPIWRRTATKPKAQKAPHEQETSVGPEKKQEICGGLRDQIQGYRDPSPYTNKNAATVCYLVKEIPRLLQISWHYWCERTNSTNTAATSSAHSCPPASN